MPINKYTGKYYYGAPNLGYDKEKLNQLFKALRRTGLMARQSFLCCGGCAGAQLAEDLGKARAKGKDPAGCAFYTKQDAQRLQNDKGTYISFGKVSFYDGEKDPKFETYLESGAVGDIIREEAVALGIKVEWNGSPEQRIWLDLKS